MLRGRVYNLFIRADAGGWNETPYELELSRCAYEHTTDNISDKYHNFTDASIRALRSFPCLFAYEGNEPDPARIGWITGIKTRQDKMIIGYKLEPSVPPIQGDKIWALSAALDIGKMEIYRTHWAVKDVELFPVLINANLVGAGAITLQPPGRASTIPGSVADHIMVRPTVFRIPTTAQEHDLVSVMMPFSAEFDPVYAAIKGSCDMLGLRCQRADNVWEHSEIIQDIFSLIFRSSSVVCDFTGVNANVFHETGSSAHARQACRYRFPRTRQMCPSISNTIGISTIFETLRD